MKKHFLHFALSCFLILWGVVAIGQTQFTAKASSTKVGKTEQFRISFSLNAKGNGFKPPNLNDFTVLQGPSRSQRTNIVNFKRSEEISFTYILRPRKVGQFTIGAAQVNANGKTYQSKPFVVTVTKQSPRASNPNDPYSQASKNVLLRLVCSKTTAYQGEPIVASYKLYYRAQVGNFNFNEEPDFTGFYKSPIEIKSYQGKTETYQNQQFETAILRQLVLIPQQTGPQKPGNVGMTVPTGVPTKRRDVFGRPMTQTVNLNVQATFPTITIKPLPSAGKPSHFNGAVGQYKLKLAVSRNELSADESLSLKFTLSGNGNLKLIELAEPEIPSAFELFDPKIKENIRVNGSGMSGTKTYEYLLIPRYGGTYKIPPMKFSYFDPSAKRYKTLQTEEQEITVSGAAAPLGTEPGIASSTKEEVQFIGNDILFIKTQNTGFKPKNTAFFKSGLFYAIGAGLGLVFLGMILYHQLVYSRQTDQQKARSQKASKLAKKHLSLANKELQKGDNTAFYDALADALWGYFSDKLNISNSQMSKEKIEVGLLEKNTAPELIEQVNNILGRAEMARYTSIGGASPKKDYDETVTLLTQLEREL